MSMRSWMRGYDIGYAKGVRDAADELYKASYRAGRRDALEEAAKMADAFAIEQSSWGAREVAVRIRSLAEEQEGKL